MSRDDIQHTHPKLLMKIMNAPDDRDAWSPGDLAAMVAHQLKAPLPPELEGTVPGTGQRAAALAAEMQPPAITFADLLAHASPSVELLTLVKDFAKAIAGTPNHPLPREVASYFYFASIAAAGRRAGTRISTLPEEKLCEGMAWLLAQKWLTGDSRKIFEVLQGGA